MATFVLTAHRSHADSNASRSSNDRKEPPHPVKKPRLSTPAPPFPKPLKGSQTNGAPHDLPPLLSPTFLPVADDTSGKWNLPPMLSPTLPAKIEAALLEEVKNPKTATPSVASNGSSVQSPAEEKKTPKSHVTSDPTPTKIRPPERAKSPPPKAVAAVKVAERATKTVPKVTGRKDLERAQTPVRKVTEEPKFSKAESVESRLSLMVKLKYKKRNKHQIERILRLPPRPIRDTVKAKQIADARENENARARASSSASQVRDRNSKQDLKEVPRSPQSDRSKVVVAEKRPRAEGSDATQAKRTKALDVNKKPSTPIQPSLLSPPTIKSGGSGKAPAQSTPRNKHLTSIAMDRSSSSSNGSDVPTPGGERTHSGTTPPATGDQGPTSAPSNGAGGTRATQLRALNELSAKYNRLGRTLKHENQAIFLDSKDRARTDDERARAALTGLECILSYMLAYTLGDARRRLEARPCELENTWVSLLPLYRHLGGSTRHSEDLRGLHAHLGAAINYRILVVANERQTMFAPPIAPPDAVDSPRDGQPDNAPTIQYPITMVLYNSVRLGVESFVAQRDCATEGRKLLGVIRLMTRFPATWESGAPDPETSDSVLYEERLVGDSGEPLLKGQYSLPLDMYAPLIQTIRFGVALLEEWCKVEGIEYEAQLKL